MFLKYVFVLIGLLVINWLMISLLMWVLYFVYGFFYAANYSENNWPQNAPERYGTKLRKAVSRQR